MTTKPVNPDLYPNPRIPLVEGQLPEQLSNLGVEGVEGQSQEGDRTSVEEIRRIVEENPSLPVIPEGLGIKGTALDQARISGTKQSDINAESLEFLLNSNEAIDPDKFKEQIKAYRLLRMGPESKN